MTASLLKNELSKLFDSKKDEFKVFDRKGSKMFEWKLHNKSDTPHAFELISYMHSSEFVKWLESLTGVHGLIPDIHLHGAGYMRCGKGDSLKIHTDFNWNNSIKLNRAVTLVIYLNEGWKEGWNGDLQFWDKKNLQCVKRYFPKFGNCLIWKYDELCFHGHPNPLDCPADEYRDGIRFFYYTSNATNHDPHRSLYWFDGSNPADMP